MLTGIAVELRMAMAALLTAAAATDARKWMTVYTELDIVRNQCLKVMRHARREASVDAAIFDEAQQNLVNGNKGAASDSSNRLPQLGKSTNPIIHQLSNDDEVVASERRSVKRKE